MLPATKAPALLKIITSSAKRRCEIRISSLQKGVEIKALTAHSCIEDEKNSMTIENRYGERGHPCLSPVLLLKNPHDFSVYFY